MICLGSHFTPTGVSLERIMEIIVVAAPIYCMSTMYLVFYLHIAALQIRYV